MHLFNLSNTSFAYFSALSGSIGSLHWIRSDNRILFFWLWKATDKFITPSAPSSTTHPPSLLLFCFSFDVVVAPFELETGVSKTSGIASSLHRHRSSSLSEYTSSTAMRTLSTILSLSTPSGDSFSSNPTCSPATPSSSSSFLKTNGGKLSFSSLLTSWLWLDGDITDEMETESLYTPYPPSIPDRWLLWLFDFLIFFVAASCSASESSWFLVINGGKLSSSSRIWLWSLLTEWDAFDPLFTLDPPSFLDRRLL